MGNTVGILALKALYNPSNIGQITNQVKRDIEKIEQQAGEIDLKVKAPDMSEFQDRIVRASDSIQNLQKRKLKGFNLSDIMGGLFGTFADPDKNAKDYAEEMENTLKKLRLITQVPDYELMRDFTSKELNAVLRRQEQLEFEKQVKNNSRQSAQENVDKIKNQKVPEIINSFTDDESRIYGKYKSKKNILQLSKKIGLDFQSLDKESQDAFGKYVRLLQIQGILKNRKKDISQLNTSDDILNEIQNYKNLEHINKLLKKTGETLQSLGAVNLPVFESFDKQIFDATKRYRDLLSQEAKTDDEIQKIEQERDKYIIDTYKKRSKKNREVEDAKLEESEKNFQKKYSSDSDSKDTKKKDTSFDSNTLTGSDVKPSVSKDIWKQAFEDVKKDYLSYAKYAVDEETALQELNRLSEAFVNDENYFNKDDLKDFNGYIQSLKNRDVLEDSLPDNVKKILNSNDYKDTLDLWKDSIDIPKLQDQISKMFDAQKSAYDKLYKESTPDDNIERKSHGNDRGDNNTGRRNDFDDIEYNENISKMAQDANEMYQYISNINSVIPKLSSGLEGLSKSSFKDMVDDFQKIEESSKNIIKQATKHDSNTSKDINEDYQKAKDRNKELLQFASDGIKFDNETGWLSTYDLVNSFYDEYKASDAYLQKADKKIKELAILIKNGKRIDDQYEGLSDTGSVNIGSSVKKYNPNAILHTHPFNSEIDNLRFSERDIESLVDGTIQKAFLMCGDELATIDMTGISKNVDFKQLQQDLLMNYQSVFARFGAQFKDNKFNTKNLAPEIKNQITDYINFLTKRTLQEYGGDLFFDKFDHDKHNFENNDLGRLKAVSEEEDKILIEFAKAFGSKNISSAISELQKKYPIIPAKTESQKPKYTVAKESPKIKKNIKDLISEDSNGQMYMTDAKPSKQIIDSQNDIQSSIKETNQQIKGQINLFDDLGDKKRASSKLDHENKPNKDQLNKSADPSSEIAGMQQLSQAVDQVTSAVERKTLAFIDEEDVVGQVSNLESSSMQSLSKSIDKVTDAVEKRNLKLLEGEEYSSQIADIEIENQKKTQNAIGDTSKEKQKTINEDKKNIENNNSHSSSSNSRNSNKSRKPNSSNKETHNIPSTYVRNIDTAYDQALKINKIIDQADQLKNNLMFDGLDSGDGFKDRLDSITKYLKESSKIDIRYAENEINKVRALQKGLSFKEMLTDPMSDLNVSQMPSVVNNISSQIDELNSQLDSGSISVNKYNSELEKLQNRMSRADDYANSASEAIDKMNKKAMEAFGGKGKITQEPTKYDKNGKRIETVTASYDGDVFKQSWQEADNIIEHTTKTTKQSTSLIGNFFDGLKQRWTSLGQYLLSFGSFYEVFDILKQGFGIITDLDDALTEMNKVSDMPLTKLQDFQKESFNIADGIGSTGLQIQQSTADFLRLGESFNEAQKSAEAANVLYNVSEFESIDAATESLIAMSAAYQDLDKMEINDKLNNVGNNFSISTDGLATALQKSASALTTAGADIDKSIALITAGNAVVQDPDSVGAGIRTIALRLMGTEEAKKELEETGEDTSDFVVQTASKINEQFKAFTAVAKNDWKGISILDDNGNNRDPYEILQDVADIYEDIVETDKKFGTNHLNALLELMAGKNRANIAASIIQNPGTLREAYEASLSSEGSALEENQKHLDSISGHLDQLKNKWQEVWSGTGRDVVNPILDIASGILDIVNNIGLLQTALMGVAAFFGAKSMLSKDGLLPNLLG